MLKELWRWEESFEDGSKITYLLQVGFHADSIICKMFWYKRDRDNWTYLHFQVLRSENKSHSSSRTFISFYLSLQASLFTLVKQFHSSKSMLGKAAGYQ